MFGRPRCREWTPLATQQLRLRSLIQIVGYNIRPPESCSSQCSFYLTLHHTTMSAPFYTSERISSPHPKWKEIDSDITQRMSSANVVIRIWCHILQPSCTDNSSEKCNKIQDTIIQTWGVYFSGLRYIGANQSLNFTSDCFKSNTLVFQMHGGYFCSYKSLKLDVIPPENELEQGSLSSDSSGKTNTSKKITIESKFIQNHSRLNESRSMSPRFSRKGEKEYSKSNSPVEKGFKQNFPTMRPSSSLNIVQNQPRDRRRDDYTETRNATPPQIYEHSPNNLNVKEFTSTDVNCDNVSKNLSQEDLFTSKIDLSETAESYDLRNETDWAPKYRYLALNFLKSEIRPSYNASKLQKLHLLQYSIKKRQEAVQEIKERIYKNSALANLIGVNEKDSDKVKARSRSQRNLFSQEENEDTDKESLSQSELNQNGKIKVDDKSVMSNGPRLTLKLNDLLSFKSKPSPFQRAEHVRLTKQIEILRFKRIILSDERDSKLANIRRLKEVYTKLFEQNQDVGTELMQDYHALSRQVDALKETRQSCFALRELAARSHTALANRRVELLSELAEVFYIEQKGESTWTICNVKLPICGDDNIRTVTPISDSVAAGLAAQATCLTAALLGQPLRYKITLLGSASKILDVTPNLPDPNIPLFARGGDLTLFRYAMFLLNKCIAQLLYCRGLPVVDMRPTLCNLKRLMGASYNVSDTAKLFGTHKWLGDHECPRTQSLRSLVASDRGKYGRQFNRFKDCVDGQSPQTLLSLQRHRHSRSVGSYQDDNELSTLDASTTSIMGSEPNIYNTKLTTCMSAELQGSLKSHNSDSELSKADTNSNKVVFTLGDDTTLRDIQTERLVRISTNNEDEITCSACLDENVKRICSEIADYCNIEGSERQEEEKDDIHEGYDVAKDMGDADVSINIAKYMEVRKTSVDIEDSRTCDACESNEDGVCKDFSCAKNVVTEVIVIPSFEAMLDTGQEEKVDIEQS